MRRMDKEVLIHVRGLQTMDADGEQEPLEIVVPGQYYFRNGSHYLRYEEILEDDGVVEFKTDNKGLFEFSLEEVGEAGWKLLAHTFDLHNQADMMEGNVMTEYEEKFSSMGNPICKLIAKQGKPEK